MRNGFQWAGLMVLALAGASIGHDALAKAGMSARLFVTNSIDDSITVIDVATQKVLGEIKVGEHVHGVCAQADGRRIFTTVKSEKVLKVIDTATDSVTDTIALPGRPNQCAATADGHYVAVPLVTDGAVVIIDVAQKKIVKSLPVKAPHNCFNTGSNDDMYCSSMGDHEIDRIDMKTLDFAQKIPVGGIPRPFDVRHDQKVVYVALSFLHGFEIVDIPDQKIVERVALPDGPPSACAPLEPADTFTHGLALTPDGKKVWVTSVNDHGVYVYDLATKATSKEIPTGRCPNWISISPDGKYVTVSNAGSDNSSIINSKTEQEIARIKVGKGPKRLLVIDVPAA